ncbi:MAG: hypothetical protein L6Q35_05100 [Phycisphaerales bacterium]|nr:hypothetical protein [Phycisphaerales bacterium]
MSSSTPRRRSVCPRKLAALAVTLGAVAGPLQGCADDGATGPVYEQRDVKPVTLDEKRGTSTYRVWK